MFKLIHNELIKSIKKTSFIVFLAIIIVGIVCSFILLELNKNPLNENKVFRPYYDMLYSYEDSILKATDAEKVYYEKLIKLYKYGIDNKLQFIFNANGENYKENLCTEISALIENNLGLNDKTMLKDYTTYNSNSYNNIEDIEILEDLLYNKTYEDYINFNKNEITNNFKLGYYSKEKYDILINEQDMYLRYNSLNNFDKNVSTRWKNNFIRKYKKIENDLLAGFNEEGNKYTKEEISKLNDDLKLITYSLDNNIDISNLNNYGTKSNSYYRAEFESMAKGISMFFVTILIIVLASASISEEFEKGTIKMLLITPFKRYKILLSKILAITIIAIVLTVAVSQIIYVFSNIVYLDSINPYIYINNSNVEVINTYTYSTIKYILILPEILIHMLVGTMFSVLFTKTALSNTFSMMIYLGMPVGMALIGAIIGIKEWFRYIPYNNFDLASKVFNVSFNSNPNYISSIFENITGFIATPWFSLSVVIVYAAIIGVITFGLFDKKEV